MTLRNDTLQFGRAVRHEWMLDPDFLTVNHGSFGATPRVVLDEQDAWRRRMEAQPTRFMRAVLPDALRAAATRLAKFVGAAGEDVVFVENATAGCNAVLRSLDLQPGDEIIVLDHGYRAVQNAVRYVAERAGARLVEIALPFPRPTADAVVTAIEDGLTSRTRLAVIDHITSPSALVLPIARIVEACHGAHVPILVDGAHGPGQVTLSLDALGADYYVGNCHKWLMAPKGCGFLHARRDRQAGLHPLTISHGFGSGFLAEFDWTGTTDFSAFLSVPAAIEVHTRLGGEALQRRNIALAGTATDTLARLLGTDVGATPAVAGAMGIVRLPRTEPVHAAPIRDGLLRLGTDAPVHAIDGGVWMRISAAAYNELEDYVRLEKLVSRLTREVCQ